MSNFQTTYSPSDAGATFSNRGADGRYYAIIACDPWPFPSARPNQDQVIDVSQGLTENSLGLDSGQMTFNIKVGYSSPSAAGNVAPPIYLQRTLGSERRHLYLCGYIMGSYIYREPDYRYVPDSSSRNYRVLFYYAENFLPVFRYTSRVGDSGYRSPASAHMVIDIGSAYQTLDIPAHYYVAKPAHLRSFNDPAPFLYQTSTYTHVQNLPVPDIAEGWSIDSVSDYRYQIALYQRDVTSSDSVNMEMASTQLARENKEVVGWIRHDPDGSLTFTKGESITADRLTAQSVLIPIVRDKSYTITLDVNGGTYPESSWTAWHGEVFTIPYETPVREGYVFTGWENGKSGAIYQPGYSSLVTASLTLVAQWQVSPTHVIQFDPNGGAFPTGVSDTKTVTEGAPYGELPVPVRTGFVFDGWFTDPAAGTQITSGTIVPAVPPTA